MQINQNLLNNWEDFKSRKRAYWSLIIFLCLFFTSIIAEVFIGSRPILVKYESEFYFPILFSYPETTFGGIFEAEADYTDSFIKEQFNKDDNWAIYRPIPWDYDSLNRDIELQHPSPPSYINWLGTDDRGRDVLTRLIFGFRISVFFGLLLFIIEIIIGISIGSILGYLGGKADLIVQRLIEIWSGMPALYVLLIVASIVEPSFFIMISILSLWSWIGTQQIVRAEFLRSRNRDYVNAAKALGVSNFRIIIHHILPNTLTLVITSAPFAIAAGMTSLIMLDFLGLGLPHPTPSIGELLNQGQNGLNSPGSVWWINIPTIGITVLVLVLISFIGEAILDVFDPKRKNYR